MAELDLAYQARSYSTGIVGRSICNARNHHWVAENTGGEAVSAGELFCASIAACAVNMVETIATNLGFVTKLLHDNLHRAQAARSLDPFGDQIDMFR